MIYKIKELKEAITKEKILTIIPEILSTGTFRLNGIDEFNNKWSLVDLTTDGKIFLHKNISPNIGLQVDNQNRIMLDI